MCGGRKERKFFQWWLGNPPECRAGFPGTDHCGVNPGLLLKMFTGPELLLRDQKSSCILTGFFCCFFLYGYYTPLLDRHDKFERYLIRLSKSTFKHNLSTFEHNSSTFEYNLFEQNLSTFEHNLSTFLNIICQHLNIIRP